MNKDAFIYELKSRINLMKYCAEKKYFELTVCDKREINVYEDLINKIENGDFDE